MGGGDKRTEVPDVAREHLNKPVDTGEKEKPLRHYQNRPSNKSTALQESLKRAEESTAKRNMERLADQTPAPETPAETAAKIKRSVGELSDEAKAKLSTRGAEPFSRANTGSEGTADSKALSETEVKAESARLIGEFVNALKEIPEYQQALDEFRAGDLPGVHDGSPEDIVRVEAGAYTRFRKDGFTYSVTRKAASGTAGLEEPARTDILKITTRKDEGAEDASGNNIPAIVLDEEHEEELTLYPDRIYFKSDEVSVKEATYIPPGERKPITRIVGVHNNEAAVKGADGVLERLKAAKPAPTLASVAEG